MGETSGTPLDSERYVNLETFRANGTGVKTPVWAAALDGKLVIFTDGTSHKVKRLRANPKVRVAACDMRGNIKGAWFDGSVRILQDDDDKKRAMKALGKKYGWQVTMLNVFSFIGRRIGRRAYLEVTIPK